MTKLTRGKRGGVRKRKTEQVKLETDIVIIQHLNYLQLQTPVKMSNDPQVTLFTVDLTLLVDVAASLFCVDHTFKSFFPKQCVTLSRA